MRTSESIKRLASLAWGGGNGLPVLLAALSLWCGLLVGVMDLPISGMTLILFESAGIYGVVRGLAPARYRLVICTVFAVALLAYTAEILLVQTLPQWSDSFPDSTRYDGNARALARHWQGLAVSAADFNLKGLTARNIPEWLPTDGYDYTTVLGMSRYLYQIWVAIIYALSDGSRMTAIFSNVPLLAGMAAGVYLLADSLFGRRVAGVATLLVMLDPNFAVWGSVLLREALMLFLIVLALLASVRMLKSEGTCWSNVGVLTGALGLLSVLRFNVVAALLLAMGCALLSGVQRPAWRSILTGLAGLIALVAIAAQFGPRFRTALENSLPGQIVMENVQIFQGAERVLEAARRTGNAHDAHVNSVRQQWHTRLREQPLWLNGVKAIARTLMGPYPWVALTHGISGNNFYELMYPGMTLWIFFLPAFFFAGWRLPWRQQPALLMCLIWLAVEAAIYIIGYGEFGGRERIIAMPLMWILATQGTLMMAYHQTE